MWGRGGRGDKAGPPPSLDRASHPLTPLPNRSAVLSPYMHDVSRLRDIPISSPLASPHPSTPLLIHCSLPALFSHYTQKQPPSAPPSPRYVRATPYPASRPPLSLTLLSFTPYMSNVADPVLISLPGPSRSPRTMWHKHTLDFRGGMLLDRITVAREEDRTRYFEIRFLELSDSMVKLPKVKGVNVPPLCCMH